MTKRVSEFGKRWDVRVPRNALKHILGRVHVGMTDEEVTAMVEARCTTPGFTPSLVRQCVRYAIECHHQNQNLYDYVMKGR